VNIGESRFDMQSELPVALDSIDNVLAIFQHKLISNAFASEIGRHELVTVTHLFGDIAAELARCLSQAWSSTARFTPIAGRLQNLFQHTVATVLAATAIFEELRYVEFN